MIVRPDGGFWERVRNKRNLNFVHSLKRMFMGLLMLFELLYLCCENVLLPGL